MSLPTTHEESNVGAPTEFQRRLGLFDVTMLVVGTMIGSGIFVTSVAIARDVGSAGWLMVTWVLAGLMTILGALAYAELAAMMPHAGGQYVFLREAYSPLWGFLYGWSCFLVIQTGSIAAVAVAFAKYLGVLWPAVGTEVNLGEGDSVRQLTAFFPSLADLGTDAVRQPAIIIFAKTHLNLSISLLPGMEPFFEMKHFVVTAGQLVAVAVLLLLTWVNCRGLREGKLVQNVLTVAKTAALILLIVVGLLLVSSSAAWQANSADLWGGITGTDSFASLSAQLAASTPVIALMVMGGAMVGSLFSMDAWNNITFTAGETKDPRRNLPLGLALGTGSVIILYLLANTAYMVSLPVRGNPEAAMASQAAAEEKKRAAEELTAAGKLAEAAAARAAADDYLRAAAFERGIDHAQDERVATAVMELWSPGLAAPLMAIAIMISTFGCVNGMALMGARLYFVMAQDNLFFRSVGTLNRRAVPAAGLVLQGLWSSLLVFSGTYNDLLDYVMFVVLVFYALTVVGLFVLRRKQPDLERPVKAFGYPFLPALYVVLCSAFVVNLLVVKPKFTVPGLLIVLSGIPVYFAWRAWGRNRPAVAGESPSA